MSDPVIAVVCAAHRGNGGMFSVDHAALSYFKKRPCRFDLMFTQAEGDAPLKIRQRQVTHLTDPEDLKKYTHVVYWGDFLNNPVYGRGDFARRDVAYGLSVDRQQAFERWKSIFVRPPVSKKAKLISIGNNFQHNFSDFGTDFVDLFEDIQRSFHAILPRDSFSFQNVSRALSFDRQHIVKQGIDCAFLNDGLLEPVEKGDTFCYTFNRSKIPGVERLVEMIEERTGLTGINVSNWLRLRRARAASDFDSCRRIIATSRFSLSDTYHFLINSIVLGTPVVALGNAAAVQTGTLGDFKKQTLFSMLGLEDAYFEFKGSSVNSIFARVADSAEQIVRGNFPVAQRYGITRALTAKFRSDIDFAIFGRRDFDTVPDEAVCANLR